jgi:hydroxypyruvate reductase
MIENETALKRTPFHSAILRAIEAGLSGGHPEWALKAVLTVDNNRLTVGDSCYDISNFEAVRIIGGGNVAGAVSTVLADDVVPELDLPVDGAVVSDTGLNTDSIRVLPGDHPLPSERNVTATRELLDLAQSASADTLVVAIVGGGGSALLAAPAGSISLKEYRETVSALLRSGADIHDINAVRKHCSAIKGGRLAETLSPAPVLALVFSDVVGDDRSTIASGPLWPDETTYEQALAVLDEHDITVPASVRDHLEAGIRAEHPETPTGATADFEHVKTELVASTETAIEAARDELQTAGYRTKLLSTKVTGSAEAVGKRYAHLGRSVAASDIDTPIVLLAGGETTVKVTGDGTGGPSQTFALSAALDLAEDPPNNRKIVVASVDTDGIDGSSDAAGAIVDGSTVEDLEAARAALASNDAGSYLAGRNALIETGPTGTNVNDLYVVGVASR